MNSSKILTSITCLFGAVLPVERLHMKVQTASGHGPITLLKKGLTKDLNKRRTNKRETSLALYL